MTNNSFWDSFEERLIQRMAAEMPCDKSTVRTFTQQIQNVNLLGHTLLRRRHVARQISANLY